MIFNRQSDMVRLKILDELREPLLFYSLIVVLWLCFIVMFLEIQSEIFKTEMIAIWNLLRINTG